MWGLLIIIAIFGLPIAITWVIMKARQKREGPDNQDYGGEYDEAGLNPVPLRQFTVTGSTSFSNPPPGYTDEHIPRD
jgi:hypothetical protein